MPQEGGLDPALNTSNAQSSSMDIKSRDMMAAVYPDVKDFRAPLDGYETLLSNDKAKKLLNWQPFHSWRDNVAVVQGQ
ncbi:hypothetical protein O9H85_06975 [Paenibacillus filicis]|uniref:NAD(P)-binding domain-containing protein n=1 Tax=Paenibacillus gyeongsangnamensis TaxID=3388067 RepID=A0ABT4Q5T0_9BACL|nr:hypothetical protein [Paenibacillus filicis]MCZ8512173.1 hypothetical protein [Paenibacillus filicis]